MDWLVAIGCASLGVLIGVMVRIYVARALTFGFAVLTGAISVLGGGGVAAIFTMLSRGFGSPAPREYWAYPIGLLVGFVWQALLEPDKSNTST